MCIRDRANPAFILIFVALFAAWGISYDGIGFTDGMIMILGVLGGASLWWFTLTFCVSLLRKKFRPRHLLWINRVTGAVIVVLGAVAILSIFIQIQGPVHGVLPLSLIHIFGVFVADIEPELVEFVGRRIARIEPDVARFGFTEFGAVGFFDQRAGKALSLIHISPRCGLPG